MNAVTLRLSVVETATEWVVFCDSEHGSTSCHLPAPFEGADLETTLRELESSILRSSAKVITRRAHSPERVARQFGQRLTDILLKDRARLIFDRCRAQARERHEPMRILLSTDGPRASQIPWEFAVDPDIEDDHLALRVSVVRSPRVSKPIPPLRVAPPLRVLGIQSLPHDLPPLEIQEERRRISRAFATVRSDLVDVTWLPGDRWSDISTALREHPWHVLHFVGHGGFSSELESGYLELSDENGRAKRVPATDIGRAVASCPALRLVVINACESASTGAAGVFSSTAAKLMNEGVPAVVAMQFEITDPAALAFAASFYEAVARATPVDQAVTLARETLKVTLGSLEWATPVLFLASTETRLFEIDGEPAESPAPVVAESAPAREWVTDLRDRIGQSFEKAPTEPELSPPPVEPARSAEPARLISPPRSDVPPVRRIDASSPVGQCTKAAVSPDGLVALICADETVRIWSPSRGREIARCHSQGIGAPSLLAWSPWRRHVVTAGADASAVLWDLEREVPQLVIPTGWTHIAAVAFSTNGRWLALAGPERRIHVYGADGSLARQFQVEDTDPAEVDLLAFSPGDRRLLVARDNGILSEVDVHGEVRQRWRHPKRMIALAVAPDRVATSLEDGRLRVWSWDGRLIYRTQRNEAEPYLCFVQGGTQLVALGENRALTVRSAAGLDLGYAELAGPPAGCGATEESIVTVTDAGVVERWAAPKEPSR